MQLTNKNEKIQMVIVISCVIFAFLMLSALIIGLINLAVANSRKNALEQELAQLNAIIEQNDSDISYYQTDEYIDRIAREYLNMQGKGETTFVG